ncbi:MAG: FKBP-type peptidyl-prolyl cis-trans isomerase [Prevotellaceae bacterium]|jgi:FKBP-type peptidyl-prolyl cis-trans isomerase|nr:FKBP-type peptidyl-prolyl cis-trans isomerase [Prevotellaceae bacterium]
MKKSLVFCICVLYLWYSCSKENPVEKQETRIESYIKTKMGKNPGLKLSQTGAVFYLYSPGDTTVKASVGDSVYFYYAGALVNDTLKYFDTNIRELAEAMGLDEGLKTFDAVGVIVGRNNLLTGLSTGLQMVHRDDSGEIIFNSDLGFGDKPNGIVPPNSALIFKIFISKIVK